MIRLGWRSLLSGATIALMLGQPALADVNTDANALFVRAVQAWTEAQALAADDPALAQQRQTLIAQANAALDTILSDLPGSDIAVKVVIGETVGTFDIAAVRAALATPVCAEATTPACLIDAAMAEMAAMDESMPREFAAMMILEAMIAAEDPQAALDLLAGYPDLAEGHYGGAIVQTLARTGLQDEAMALVVAEADPIDQIRLLEQLALGLSEAGQIDDAMLILAQNDDPRVRLDVLAAAGQFDAAALLIADIQAEAQEWTRSHLAVAAAKAGEIELAQELAGEIVDRDLVRDPVIEIALAQARAGLAAEALATHSRLTFGHVGVILRLWHNNPDPAFVAALRAHFDGTYPILGSRREIVLGLSIMDPSPEVLAELDSLNALTKEEYRTSSIYFDTLLLCEAGRYSEAAALTLVQPPETMDLLDRITNLTLIARLMAIDPQIN